MTNWLEILTKKKNQLDKSKTLPVELIKNLDDWLRVELTHTSNALEGNTLTRQETALVIDKGLAVSGKTITEHQEAVNHAQAWGLVKQQAESSAKITQSSILGIHQLVLKNIDDSNAGRYRTVPVRIAGSTVILPNALKVPELMEKLVKDVQSTKDHPVKIAADAHYQLVTIHPFADGNGRTARLLMNLILLQAGYPAAIIKKEERLKYINSLEKAQLGGDRNDFYDLIYTAVDRSIAMYLDAALSKQPSKQPVGLLKIGELAKATSEPIATLRFWVTSGLIKVSGHTKGGYQLFDQSAIALAPKIRKLQQENRLSLKEIRKHLLQ